MQTVLTSLQMILASARAILASLKVILAGVLRLAGSATELSADFADYTERKNNTRGIEPARDEIINSPYPGWRFAYPGLFSYALRALTRRLRANN